MKLFRLRFILLGLLLCVYHVWCLTCGTEFDDPVSSGYLAEIVVIGTVSQTLPMNSFNKYNATIKIKNRRDTLKGLDFLRRGRNGAANLLYVGEFGEDNLEKCVADIKQDSKYLFFMNTTADGRYFKLSAMPLSEDLKKVFKRAKKGIKRVYCGGNNCVQVPEPHHRKYLKNRDNQIGKSLELNCRLRKKPLPVALFKWYKNGTELVHKGPQGFTIRNGKKGSRLKKSKAGLSDSANYTCLAINAGGHSKQESVITIVGATPPEVGPRPLQNKDVKYGGTLTLRCKTKGSILPLPQFTWYKNGEVITRSFMRRRPGLSIKSKGYQSVLRKKSIQEGDNGNYECVAENVQGKARQLAVITVVEGAGRQGPQKRIPCEAKDANWCLNNGTCEIMVELKRKFCLCRADYQGTRCQELMFEKIQEAKLAQDRTLVIVGIISGILLFIAICVASYFLAKRRRSEFHRRRREREPRRGNIEDNIPQVYRPLIGCDEIDGIKQHCTMNGVIIHKCTQTIETCFIGASDDGKTNLYINPHNSYVGLDRNDKNARDRLTGVSLEGDTKTDNRNQDDETILDRKNQRNNSSNSEARNGNIGTPNGDRQDTPNDPISPNTFVFEKCKSTGVASGKRKNDLGSINPPAFNIDESESDDEIQNKDVLTPLHISEDEGTRGNRKSIGSNEKSRDNKTKEVQDMNISRPPKYEIHIKDVSDTPTPNEDIYASDSSSTYTDSDSSSTTEGCDSPNTAMKFAHSFSDPDMEDVTCWKDTDSSGTRSEAPYSNPNSEITGPYFNNNRPSLSKKLDAVKENIPLRNLRGTRANVPS